MSKRLPDFLVIGAMKCGTTTLYRDLLSQPEILIPDKEINFFARCTSLDDETLAAYATRFQRAGTRQLCGDVSTEYSMLPDLPGTAERAREVLGPRTKIIYLVREPVRRAVSHHFHMFSWHGDGRMDADINASVRCHDSIVNYSRYAMQLQPWREAFGDDAIRVIVFEEFVEQRAAVIASLCEFLGLRPHVDRIRDEVAYNRSDAKPVMNPFWLAIHDSSLYRRFIRPNISPALKDNLRSLLLPKSPPRPTPPSLETVDYIISQVADDVGQLQQFLGRSTPIWDLDQVRRSYAAGARAA